jgi:cytochrome c-type biogenesis protein CcmF
MVPKYVKPEPNFTGVNLIRPISPIQVVPAEESNQGQLVNLIKDKIAYFEDYTLKFIGYEMDPHDVGEDEIYVQAIINGSGSNGNFVLKPAIKVTGQERTIIHDRFPDVDRDVHLHSVDIEESSLTLMIDSDKNQMEIDESRKEILAIEISEKPLINLLWLGTFIMIAGLIVSLKNRAHSK